MQQRAPVHAHFHVGGQHRWVLRVTHYQAWAAGGHGAQVRSERPQAGGNAYFPGEQRRQFGVEDTLHDARCPQDGGQREQGDQGN